MGKRIGTGSLKFITNANNPWEIPCPSGESGSCNPARTLVGYCWQAGMAADSPVNVPSREHGGPPRADVGMTAKTQMGTPLMRADLDVDPETVRVGMIHDHKTRVSCPQCQPTSWQRSPTDDILVWHLYVRFKQIHNHSSPITPAETNLLGQLHGYTPTRAPAMSGTSLSCASPVKRNKIRRLLTR